MSVIAARSFRRRGFRALPALVLAAYLAVLGASPVGEALRTLAHLAAGHHAPTVLRLAAMRAAPPAAVSARAERAEHAHAHRHGDSHHHPAIQHPAPDPVPLAALAHDHDGRVHTHEAEPAADDPAVPPPSLEKHHPHAPALVPEPALAEVGAPAAPAPGAAQHVSPVRIPPPRPAA